MALCKAERDRRTAALCMELDDSASKLRGDDLGSGTLTLTHGVCATGA
jgi:hypothetical protein